MTTVQVYKSIADIAGELAKIGIGKNNKNQQQGYKFRGIDDIYNALAPLLAAHGLVILPRVLERNLVEKATKSGGSLFYVTIKVDFDFVSSADGSRHTVTTYGEAMDSGDKATNKAMSAAYKYACLQAFCIPTEGDNDADATTHEVVYRPENSRIEQEPSPFKDNQDRKAWLARYGEGFDAVETLTEWRVLKQEVSPNIKFLGEKQNEWLAERMAAAEVRLSKPYMEGQNG